MKISSIGSVLSLFLATTAFGEDAPTTNSFSPRTVINVGLGLGVASFLRADIQFRNNESRFWSVTAGTGGIYQTFNASINWKNLDGWNDSSYWLLGGGLIHASIPTLFFGNIDILTPEVHAGWGYEWFTSSQARHAIELRLSYPEVASLHYMFGF